MCIRYTLRYRACLLQGSSGHTLDDWVCRQIPTTQLDCSMLYSVCRGGHGHYKYRGVAHIHRHAILLIQTQVPHLDSCRLTSRGLRQLGKLAANHRLVFFKQSSQSRRRHGRVRHPAAESLDLGRPEAGRAGPAPLRLCHGRVPPLLPPVGHASRTFLGSSYHVPGVVAHLQKRAAPVDTTTSRAIW